MSVFAYWCRLCRAWWDSEVTAAEADLIRRRHAASPVAFDDEKLPGQHVCPGCGKPSTQDLPTEFSAAAYRIEIREGKTRAGMASEVKHDLQAI